MNKTVDHNVHGHQTVLLVDDSENDLILVRMAFEKAFFRASLQEVQNGEAIAYLGGQGIYADRLLYPLLSTPGGCVIGHQHAA